VLVWDGVCKQKSKFGGFPKQNCRNFQKTAIEAFGLTWVAAVVFKHGWKNSEPNRL